MEYDSVDSEELLSRMRILNKKFKNACNQVILLNNQIEHLQVRYDRAVHSNKRSYRYFLRLRLATLEGIRNMFYEYACRRADQLDEMQDQLVQEGVIDSDYDMDDVDSESEAQQWNSGSGVANDEYPESMSEEEEDTSPLGSLQADGHPPHGVGSGHQSETMASGHMWSRQSVEGGYGELSENTLSNHGSSDEETFPIERPESPESVGGAAGEVSLTASESDYSEEGYTRVSPVKPGAAAKTINAIGQKLVNIGGSTRARVDAAQAGSPGNKCEERSFPGVDVTTAIGSVSGYGGRLEHSGTNVHLTGDEGKEGGLLKVRASQDPSDAPRQAKTARLNNGC